MYKRLAGIFVVMITLSFMIAGCTSQASNIGLARENNRESVGSDFVVAQVGSYDSADTAVVLSVDADISYATFMNIATGRQYTLSYDGTTYVKDKYESPMSMSQLKAGDIVDVTFLKSKKKLASVQLSPRAWTYDNVENYDLGGINKTAQIGSNTYSLPDDVVVLSEGERTEVMDIVKKDVLTISGIDHQICSINIEKGHGYIRLSNEQALVGGWIEIGNVVIQQITENMLLTVPEGSYQVVLSNGGTSCTKDVIIERDKEVILNIGDLEIVQDKTGIILLSVEPDSATVSIDGKPADISQEIELTYGIHSIRLEAEGYQTLTKYIQVGSEYARLSFTMEEKTEETEEDTDDNQQDNNTDKDVEDAVTGNKVYIDAPVDVEVYMDGSYMGVSPVNFTKVTGSHTIVLRKPGYVSKSYTIYLYDDGQDITYSFTDLEKDGSQSGSSKNTSSKSTTSTHNEGSSSTSIVTSHTTSSKTTSSSSGSTVSGNE
ncbi:MAG: PEGA domain-containing protein [Blautia sp.]|nr:PEGA domain-containing protein [Lachnoclostridium sp.]MCM1212789.1 PEGA domain-containing protein [Blautia sp.]